MGEDAVVAVVNLEALLHFHHGLASEVAAEGGLTALNLEVVVADDGDEVVASV